MRITVYWLHFLDKSKRQTLLVLGTVALGYGGIRILPSLLPQEIIFEEMDTPSGFRRFVAGESSSAFDPFIGLGSPEELEAAARKEAAAARVSASVCDALYGELTLSSSQVPLASFSDYYCPFCRVQTKRLAEFAKSAPDEIAVAWHELPLLGETSNMAARAALAAKRQGAYVEFHERLMKSPFRASPEFLGELAEDLNVERDQLVRDMSSDSVTRELEDSSALSRLFAFVGTPALVVGRTVIQGQVSDATLKKIIELEREQGWESVCATA